MRTIHVITQKEAVDKQKLSNCTVVVIDVFLATSTIIFLLEKNYSPIYAVNDTESALAIKEKQDGPYLLLGEAKAKSIEGFLYPDPSQIKQTATRKAAIICSTNGTKAIKKAEKSKRLFISSLINGHIVAEKIHIKYDQSSIVIICSGNDNRFSIEDFVGAGQIIDHLVNKGDYTLSDSSKLALETYRNFKENQFHKLYSCETAALLYSVGFGKSIDYVMKHIEKVNIVPILDGDKIIINCSITNE